jgi:hypothetical protein
MASQGCFTGNGKDVDRGSSPVTESAASKQINKTGKRLRPAQVLPLLSGPSCYGGLVTAHLLQPDASQKIAEILHGEGRSSTEGTDIRTLSKPLS